MDVDNLVVAMRDLNDDLDQCRMYWETSSDWAARKQFLIHNWNSFPDKERLIGLSCAWANIRFLGNHYPASVMKVLKEMETGLEVAEHKVSKVPAKPESYQPPLMNVYNTEKLPKYFKPVIFVKSGYLSDQVLATEKVSDEKDSNLTSSCKNALPDSSENCNEISDVSMQRLPNHVESKESSADCEKLTKELKNALKIPETIPVGQPAATHVSNNSASKTDQSIAADEYIENITLTLQSFVAALVSRGVFNSSCKVSSFFNVAINLGLNFKFVSGMCNEEQVILFNQWSLQSGVQHQISNFTWICSMYFDKVFLSQGHGKRLKIAKDMAVNTAMDLLKDTFSVRCVSRMISCSTSAFQYALTPTQSLKSNCFPPIITLQDTPMINFVKTLSSEVSSTSNAERETGSLLLDNQKNLVNSNEIAKLAIQHSEDFKSEEDLNLKKVLFTCLKKRSSSFVVVVLAFTDDPLQVISTTAGSNNVYWSCDNEFHPPSSFTCSIFFNHALIVVETSTTKESARNAAASKLLRHLIAYFPCLIKLKIPESTQASIDRNELTSKKKLKGIDKRIGSDNIGNHLLRKMGWSGSGGLGINKKGIAEPVQASGKLSRCVRGLGHNDDSVFQFKDAERVIRRYITDGCVGNLTFSSELSSEERKQLHTCAHKHGLKSKSYGKGSQRYLMLFKSLSLLEIYQRLRVVGGEVNGYILPS